MKTVSVMWNGGDIDIFTDIDTIEPSQNYVKLSSAIKAEEIIIPITSIKYLKYFTPSGDESTMSFERFKTNS